MDLYLKIKAACLQKNITIINLCEQINISRGNLYNHVKSNKLDPIYKQKIESILNIKTEETKND